MTRSATPETALADSPIRAHNSVDVIRTTLLRESRVLDPDTSDICEAHQLAEIVIRDVLAANIRIPDLSIGLRESLRSLADLVSTDPETATIDQIYEVATMLRSILDHHAAAQAVTR